MSDILERNSVVDIVSNELSRGGADAVPVRLVVESLIAAGWTRDHAVAQLQSEIKAGRVHMNERFSLSIK